jgi:hypothetical protein
VLLAAITAELVAGVICDADKAEDRDLLEPWGWGRFQS